MAARAGAAPPDTPPAGTKAGSITALLPLANIVRGPAKPPATLVAKKGDDVIWNDLVRTDKGGRARITLLDQSILSVGSQAELRIIKSDAKSQQTSLEVDYGRVRMEVTPITKQGGSFQVQTPTAVAGVIGTTFGVDSSIGSTTFLCISGTVMVGSNAPNTGGQVPCPAGTVAVVVAGKGPVTRPATQQEIQQFTQETEPAVISAMAPDSLAPGTVTDAVITGTQLGGINQASSSNSAVTVALNPGGTATSLSVHVTIAANATPGPATITLSAPSGPPSAAVFTISSSAAAAQTATITALSASTAPPSGGIPITITGTNFDANTKVMFGNVAASSVTYVSPTQLTVIVPPENPGTVDISIVTGSGLTSTFAGGFNFGGPVAALTPQDINTNPGEQLTFDGSRSSDTLAGTTLTYSWTLCSLGFKPPQSDSSLPSTNAPVCNPAPGTVQGTDSQFAPSAPLAPGLYFARLQVTDNLGASAVIFTSVTVGQPNYLDPLTCTTLLAQAFSSLQTGSATGNGCGSGGATTVLGFFDPSFPGLTTLQQSLQTVFPTYSSMQVHLVGAQLSSTGNTAIVTANWELLYTLKNDPACKNTTPCQPPAYQSSLGTVTVVWTLTPGKGWAITDFRYPNGFPQGTLPAVPNTTASSPDLQMVGVVAQGVPGNPIPIGLGAQTFVATVNNIGTATSGATTVQFSLSQLDGTSLGTATGALAALAPGASGSATGTITITVPNLTAVTQAQLVATANPGCTVPETTCANDSGTFAVVITPPNVPLPNLVTAITNVTSGATLGTGQQTIQATVTNAGNAPFTASPPVIFSISPTGYTVITAQVSITGPIAVGQVVPVQAMLNIPTTIPAGTTATLSVDVSPTCPTPVEPNCVDNTASLPIIIGVPPAIIITSSGLNTSSSTPVELNGVLTDTLTLSAARTDNITTGSVTLTLASAPEVSSNPTQLTAIPYISPQAVDFTATINSSGNVSAVPTTVVVTPSAATPPAGNAPTTLYFNVGDINLTGVPACLQIPPGGGQAQLSLGFQLINGFNAPNMSWQWSGLVAGVTVSTPSGSAVFSSGAYSPPLPTFTFTNSNPNPISGSQTFLFAVTITGSQGSSSATKVFSISFGLEAPPTPCGQAVRVGGAAVNGTWTRGAFGGGMAKAVRPAPTGPMPDLQINAASVSFTPSIPKPGDTVDVRFRVTNAGNADAQHVPIALVVNGAVVSSDTFDVRAGASTLAALEWANASVISHSPQAAVVVDPSHTVEEQSTVGKSAPLARFSFLATGPAQGGLETAGAAGRATLQIGDGGCVGFRFASGAGASCGSADVEITAEQLAGGHFTLSAQNGIADLGAAFGGGKLAGVQYQQDAQAVAGHSYAVQLSGGRTGVLRLTAIRNPGQTAAAQGRQAFGVGSPTRNVGATTGPVETGDVSGVRPSSQSKASIELTYQTQ